LKKTLLLIALALSGAAVTAAAGDFWGPEEQITNSSNSAANGAQAAGPTGTLHMLTVDSRTGVPCILYQRKPDGAQSWSSQTVLSLEAGNVQAGDCALCVDGAHGVYAVWEEFYNGSISLFLRRSADDGVTWGNRILVADPETTTMNASAPNLAVDAFGTLHLVWLSTNSGESKGRLLYRKGSADSVNLSTPVDLRAPSTFVSNPGLAVGGVKLMVYFQETVRIDGTGYEQIRYRLSADKGVQWAATQTLSPNQKQCRDPRAVGDASDHFYAVWTQDNQDVLFRHYNPSEATSDVTLDHSAGAVSKPGIALQGTKVVAAWILNAAENQQMKMKSSSDGGVNWGELSETAIGDGVETPCLINDRGNIHLFYGFNPSGDSLSFYQVYHRIRDDLAPSGPRLTSVTHPIAEPSGNNRPSFAWTGADNPGGIGLVGYAARLDNQPASDPGNTPTCSAAQTTLTSDALTEGAYYLHLRAIDLLGNLGTPAHYAVTVEDNDFFPKDQVWVAPAPVRNGRLHLRYFLTEVAEVKLEFYDGAGRKLGGRSAPGLVGINPMTFDVSDWVNGTFFYRLTARALSNGREAVVAKPFMVVR